MAKLSLSLLYFSNEKKSDFNKSYSLNMFKLITVRDFTHANSALVV